MLKMPKQIQNIKSDDVASAPYNFVPLPEKVVPIHHLPDHAGAYDAETRHSGYFEVELTTQSPLYIRGMLTQTEYERSQSDKYLNGEPLPENGNPEFCRLPKNKPDFFHTHDSEKPMIPGSSLRGMLRNLFEIVTYSKVKWVTDTHKIFYRAVAAQSNDPLSDTYKKTLKDVRVGYLIKESGAWYIQPAKRPKEVRGDLQKGYFFKVREKSNVQIDLPNYLSLNHKEYVPSYHEVNYDLGLVSYKTKKRKMKRFQGPIKIGSVDSDLPYTGVLVCAGNMKETNQDMSETIRENVILVPERSSKKRIPINEQAVQDYLDGLTPFQKKPPFDETYGALIEGNPVFYVQPQQGSKEIFFFGHTPNFRLPAWNEVEERAATPYDFVPRSLKRPTDIDYTEAVFGFIRTQKEIEQIDQSKYTVGVQGDKKKAYASRLFVTSASLKDERIDIFEPVMTPSILASPQPTTFQHYLTQTSSQLKKRNHYGSSPQKTTIRGHKLYWHQGERTISEMKPAADSPNTNSTGEVEADSTQHTRLKPVKKGVTFTFNIYFENLSKQELGALCWTLAPYGDASRTYHHRLGMAKPLGMGSVALKATLHCVKKKEYYQTLFENDQWYKAQAEPLDLSHRETLQTLIKPFEDHLLEQLQVAEWAEHLYDLKRIAILLKMLEWPGQTAVPHNRIKPDGTPNTRYMHIEHPDTKEDEFKNRPILPSPAQFGTLVGKQIEPPTWPFLIGKQYQAKITFIDKSIGAALDIPNPDWDLMQFGKEQTLFHKIAPQDVPHGAHENEVVTCQIIDVYVYNNAEIIVQYKPVAKSHKRRK